jgi:hypothetical protein
MLLRTGKTSDYYSSNQIHVEDLANPGQDLALQYKPLKNPGTIRLKKAW